MTENLPVEKDNSLPFKLMDALDDQLIIAELEGRMPEVLTYHFSDKGQEVWGLSKAGVDEATGELAKQGEVIREIELVFTDGEKEAFFNVKAGRYVISKDGKEILLDTKFGTKRQSKKTPKGNDNQFWFEQGSIKACRNASMRLIPKTIVQAVIENAKQKGKVKEIKPNGEQKAEQKVSEGKPGDAPHSPPTDDRIEVIFEKIEKKPKKDGKGFYYSVICNAERYSVFDDKLFSMIETSYKFAIPCLIAIKESGKFKNITSIEQVEPREVGEEG